MDSGFGDTCVEVLPPFMESYPPISHDKLEASRTLYIGPIRKTPDFKVQIDTLLHQIPFVDQIEKYDIECIKPAAQEFAVFLLMKHVYYAQKAVQTPVDPVIPEEMFSRNYIRFELKGQRNCGQQWFCRTSGIDVHDPSRMAGYGGAAYAASASRRNQICYESLYQGFCPRPSCPKLHSGERFEIMKLVIQAQKDIGEYETRRGRGTVPPCENYSVHGNCPFGSQCGYQHSDAIYRRYLELAADARERGILGPAVPPPPPSSSTFGYHGPPLMDPMHSETIPSVGYREGHASRGRVPLTSTMPLATFPTAYAPAPLPLMTSSESRFYSTTSLSQPLLYGYQTLRMTGPSLFEGSASQEFPPHRGSLSTPASPKPPKMRELREIPPLETSDSLPPSPRGHFPEASIVASPLSGMSQSSSGSKSPELIELDKTLGGIDIAGPPKRDEGATALLDHLPHDCEDLPGTPMDRPSLLKAEITARTTFGTGPQTAVEDASAFSSDTVLLGMGGRWQDGGLSGESGDDDSRLSDSFQSDDKDIQRGKGLGSSFSSDKDFSGWEDWTTEDVVAWLSTLRRDSPMVRECELFRQNDISGSDLVTLSNESLKDDIGIKSFGHRNAILKGIERLKKKKYSSSQ